VARDVVVGGVTTVVNVVRGLHWMGWWSEFFYYCVKSLPCIGTHDTRRTKFF
jgi:hypothetical protein